MPRNGQQSEAAPHASPICLEHEPLDVPPQPMPGCDVAAVALSRQIWFTQLPEQHDDPAQARPSRMQQFRSPLASSGPHVMQWSGQLLGSAVQV